jgi:hypothetical protein
MTFNNRTTPYNDVQQLAILYNDVQKLDTLYNDDQKLDSSYNDVQQLDTRTMAFNNWILMTFN